MVWMFVPPHFVLRHDPQCWRWGLMGSIWIMGADPSWMVWCHLRGNEWLLALFVPLRTKNLTPALCLLLLIYCLVISAHGSSPSPFAISGSSLRPHQKQILVPCFLYSVQNCEPVNYPALCVCVCVCFIATQMNQDTECTIMTEILVLLCFNLEIDNIRCWWAYEKTGILTLCVGMWIKGFWKEVGSLSILNGHSFWASISLLDVWST